MSSRRRGSSSRSRTSSSRRSRSGPVKRINKSTLKCNKPRRTSGASKKFVVKACEKGKHKIVRFGDSNMSIKRSIPERRKAFRARHKCDQKHSKLSARYWSCKMWSSKKISDILS